MVALLWLTTMIVGGTTYRDWPVGTWHIVRHLVHRQTIRLSWKIIPYRKHSGRHVNFYYGTEGYDPTTVFAWIRCSINGKPVRIPKAAYIDCGNCREFKTTFENGRFEDSTWVIRERKGKIEISTRMGVHGGRDFMTWYIAHRRYTNRQSTIFGDPDRTSAEVEG